MKFRIPLLVVLVLYTCSLNSAAEEVKRSLFADSQYQTWAREFREGNPEKAVSAIEENLRSGKPHPFAATLWYFMRKQGYGSDNLKVPVNVQETLDQSIEINTLYDAGLYHDLTRKYPPEKARNLYDILALFHIRWAAQEIEDDNLTLAYLLVELERCPNVYNTIWQLEITASFNEILRPRIEALLQDGGVLKDTPGGRYLEYVIGSRFTNINDQIYALERFVKEVPESKYAHRRLTDLYNTYTRFSDAENHARRSWEIDPFFQSSWCNYYAKCSIKQQQFDAAETTLSTVAQLFREYSGTDADRLDFFRGKCYRLAGEKGKARTILEELVKRIPDHRDAWRQIAWLEGDSNRPDEALAAARKAFETMKEPGIEDYELLIDKAYEAKEHDLVISLFEKFTTAFPNNPSTSVTDNVLKSFKARENWSAVIETAQKGLEKMPHYAQFLSILAEAQEKSGDRASAVATLERLFDLRGSYGTSKIDTYRKLLTEQYGEETAEKRITAYRERFPWHKDWWEDLASKTTNIFGYQEVWEKAMAAVPSWYQPWESLIYHYDEEKLYIDRDIYLKKWEEALEGKPHSFLQNYRTNEIWITYEKIRRGEADEEDVRKTRKTLESYYADGGSAFWYWEKRSKLHEALGEKEKAAEAFYKSCKHYPDNCSLAWSLVTEYTRSLSLGKTLGHFQHCLERDPFDSKRYQNLIQIHTMWYGHPLNALLLINKLKSFAPEEVIASHEAMARDKLGAHAEGFRDLYGKKTGIGSSFRYVS